MTRDRIRIDATRIMGRLVDELGRTDRDAAAAVAKAKDALAMLEFEVRFGPMPCARPRYTNVEDRL